MTITPLYLSLAHVEFDYEATTEDELTVTERQVVWVLEDDDPDWYKVKIKSSTSDSSHEPSGLVPASYLAPAPVIRTVTALYDYSPATTASGELENEEELEINEGEELHLLEDDDNGDWVLVGKVHGKGVGFVPGTYVEAAVGEEDPHAPNDGYAEEEQDLNPSNGGLVVVPAASSPVNAYVDPSERSGEATRSVPKASEVKTWSVSEVDKKKKKKKGTLGVGNGAIFFASESDKTPIQQYPLSSLTDVTTEKSKHLHLTFPSAELSFVISSKETFDEIILKIEEERATAQPPSRILAPPAGPSLAASSRATGVSTLPPPPIRSQLASATTPTSSAPSSIPPQPSASASRSNGVDKANATALYDFEPQGSDEIGVIEGDRLIYIEGGSDDPDWVKVKKIGSTEEGVVPASYVQLDEEDAYDSAHEELHHDEVNEEEEAAAAAADAAALRAQLESDRQLSLEREAATKRDREAKNRKRKEDERAEAARQKRLSEQPPAGPIPLPRRGEDGEARSKSGKEGRERSGTSKSSASSSSKKPAAHRVRTWKDRTGQFKVDAEFLGLNGNKIRLHKLNGVIIEVPLEKMSSEDTAYLKKVTSRGVSNGVDLGDDETPLAMIVSQEDRRNERHRRGEAAANGTSSSRKSTLKPPLQPLKKQTDWFEFFLNAGCDMDECTRYARNFDREKIEEELVGDLEAGTLRSLGLREGDIIRVMKFIKDKYRPPTPNKDDRDAQIASDAAMARNLQGSGPTPAPPNLFSGPDGALKSTRRGRPNPTRQTTLGVDSAAIASASSMLAAERSSTPSNENARGASPMSAMKNLSLDPSGRSRSASTTTQTSGFDDDAWTVKTPANPTSSAATTTAAPPPPPVNVVQPPASAPTPPAPTPIQPLKEVPQRSGSAGASASGLTYNDGLLAGMGIAQNRPSSAPLGGSFSSAGSFQGAAGNNNPSLNGPRGPVLPVAANQPLLAPLIPTRTGMPGYNPGSSMLGTTQLVPNMTGYPGMMQQPMQPMYTGMPMQNNMNGIALPMSMQPTGISYLQSQRTGIPQMNFQQNVPAFSPPPPAPVRSPVQFNPMPPPPQQQTAASASSASTLFKPDSIFASMKDGTFTKEGSPHQGPQDPSKYDALRPQPTGMQYGSNGGYNQPMIPQQTGFQGMMQAPMQQQPQMTGFQPGTMFAQPTGMPYGQNGFQGRQY